MCRQRCAAMCCGADSQNVLFESQHSLSVKPLQGFTDIWYVLGLDGAEVSHRTEWGEMARGFHTLMPDFFAHRSGESEQVAVYSYKQDVRMMFQFADVMYRQVGSRCGGGE